MKTPYPELVEDIVRSLRMLQDAGLPLTLCTLRGHCVATVEHEAPEVFTTVVGDGKCFRMSEEWLRKFLFKCLNWKPRAATRAGQKIPGDAEDQCRTSFLRQARLIRDLGIPATCRININQTISKDLGLRMLKLAPHRSQLLARKRSEHAH